MDPVAALASFLAQTDLAELPPVVIEHAKMTLASTLASAAAGVAQPSTAIARDLAVEQGGAPEAMVWFEDSIRLPVAEAARLNAMRSDAAACDDADFRTLAHTGTTVASVSLAVGERLGSSGLEVLGAIVCGYEAAGRFGEATAPRLGERGFHPAVLGGFGAAASAAKLLRLPVEQWLDAFALAASTAGGLLAGTDGWTREFQAGAAAAGGLRAALAAARGYRSPAGLVDGPRGFFATFADGADAGALADGLGVEWDIATDLGIKLRPGGYPFAAAVEAAIEAARSGDVEPDEVVSVSVSGPSLRELVGPRHPRDFVEAIHSLAYYVATAIADRDFSWRHISAPRFDDPRTERLLDLIEVVAESDERSYSFRWGATVAIAIVGGEVHASTVDIPWGSARRGIEWHDVELKARTLIGEYGSPRPTIEALLLEIHALGEAAGLSSLIALL